jgi:hypothetical protein
MAVTFCGFHRRIIAIIVKTSVANADTTIKAVEAM